MAKGYEVQINMKTPPTEDTHLIRKLELDAINEWLQYNSIYEFDVTAVPAPPALPRARYWHIDFPGPIQGSYDYRRYFYLNSSDALADQPGAPLTGQAIASWVISGQQVFFEYYTDGAVTDTVYLTDTDGTPLIDEPFRPITTPGEIWFFGANQGADAFPTDDGIRSVLGINVPALFKLIGNTFNLMTSEKEIVAAINEVYTRFRDGIHIYTSDSDPDPAAGTPLDVAVTPNAIYTKKLNTTGSGVLLQGLTGNNAALNGKYIDMGPGTNNGTMNGQPLTQTHQYMHESGLYVLVWSSFNANLNAPRSGAWVINNSSTPMQDVPNAIASSVTKQATPPNPDNTAQLTASLNANAWTPAFPANAWSWYVDTEPSQFGWERLFNFFTDGSGVPFAGSKQLATVDDITAEATARHTEISDAITQEATERQGQIDDVNDEIEKTNNVLAGAGTRSLVGALLTRVIGGSTQVAKNLFEPDDVHMAGKTLICDIAGTVGVYIGDIDSATIEVLTKTTSPTEVNGVLLGVVGTYAELPQTTTEAFDLWGQTPEVGDFARIGVDEQAGGVTTERDIAAIDGSGNITWGTAIPLNVGDYQNQTTAEMAGKVLTGGAVAGTFGDPLDVDTTPTQNSNNLLQSGAAYTAFAPANAALTAETGSGTDATTPAVSSGPITTILQTIWNKIRQVANSKANNTQATISAGSGTDTSTTTQTNPTVWGMIQNIWNRLFALKTYVDTLRGYNLFADGFTGSVISTSNVRYLFTKGGATVGTANPVWLYCYLYVTIGGNEIDFEISCLIHPYGLSVIVPSIYDTVRFFRVAPYIQGGLMRGINVSIYNTSGAVISNLSNPVVGDAYVFEIGR